MWPLIAALFAASAGAVPLPTQGRLVSAAGTPLAGTHTLDVLLEDSAGTPLWTGTIGPIALTDGLLDTTLDVSRAALDHAFTTVIREGGAELARIPRATAPHARLADRVGGVSPLWLLAGQTPALQLSLNEGAGDIAYDRSGHRSHGALGYGSMTPPNWGPGKVGGAALFNGTSDCIRVPHSASNAFLHGYTLMAWVRNDGAGGMVVAKHFTHFNRAWDLSVDAAGAAILGLYLPSNAGWALTSTQTVPPGVWTHIAGTYSPDTGDMTVYVNGKPAGSQAVGDVQLMSVSLSVTVGCYHNSASDSSYRGFFQGGLDEVTVLPYALPAATLAAYVAATP